MNRFDDAVSELLAGAPGATPVDRLRRRIRRNRRRRTFAIVALVSVISVASVAGAMSLRHSTSGAHISVSPTPSSSSPDTRWCVAVSRSQAVRTGTAYGAAIMSEPIVAAKLVSRAELLVKGNPWDAEGRTRIAAHSTFWVVDLRPSPARAAGPYTWGIVAVDATSGEVVTADEGPSTGPGGVIAQPSAEPYWQALADHGSECASGGGVGGGGVGGGGGRRTRRRRRFRRRRAAACGTARPGRRPHGRARRIRHCRRSPADSAVRCRGRGTGWARRVSAPGARPRRRAGRGWSPVATTSTRSRVVATGD